MSVPHLFIAPRARLDPERLSAADRRAYYSGDWLGEHPVKSKAIARHRSSDAEMAAEMAARIRVELEHADEEKGETG